MSDVIDWSKAPEGATHYYHNGTGRGVCSHWIRACGKGRYWIGMLRFSKLWQEDTSPVDLRHAIARPNPTPWSGEGLPPVGVVCDVFNRELSNPEWEKCTILFAGKHRFLYDSESCAERCGYIENLEFRPIRTNEQIAADEREASIKRACADIDKLVAVYNISIDCSVAIRATIEALHDAGYRKP